MSDTPTHDEFERPGDAGDVEAGTVPVRVPVPRRDRPGAPGGRGRRRWFRWVALAGSGVVVLFLVVTAWYELQIHALGPPGRLEVVHIADGESINAVAGSLSSDKVIGSTWAFRLYDLVHGNPSTSPGSYAFHQNQTFGQVRAILAGGPDVYPIRVNDGLTISEMATQVDELPGHAATSFTHTASSGAVRSTFSPTGSDDLEGLLGTGSYEVVPGETDVEILQAMVSRFEHQAAAAGVTPAAASALGVTPYQLITVASIVEKEGYIPKNMPDVARVVYNRLAAGMPLQMDATVLYSLGQDGGPVTPQEETVVSPYNSYLNKGLPPTPICSPSPNALAAASRPPAGSWLFFELVSKDGTEAFADTFAQQLANEQLAQSRGVG